MTPLESCCNLACFAAGNNNDSVYSDLVTVPSNSLTELVTSCTGLSMTLEFLS